METRSFAQWTLPSLEKAFKLKRHRSLASLTKWLDSPCEITEEERDELEVLRDQVSLYSSYWSEEELKYYVIFPVIRMAHFLEEPIRFFADRAISATVDDIQLQGIVDGLLATGAYEPELPFFCLHEYKPEDSARKDHPAAQVLSAMLAAQELDEDDKPIYGAYMVGRMWFFLALEGRDYAISTDYSAASGDIEDILRILRSLKPILIEERDLADLEPAVYD